ncbi:aldo/keto reductase family domain-containing protein [Ditylenchus destructor]|uniref:Aldo/keto reductase family domain-containing protein n=1 Tax=Ditylenchus destructor TaxID=166010 RepID=A0AAD4N8G2_9BILA|nr:aldo/keto reductase family domain-containing protein [Ditylenchus destructor]
MAVNVGSIALSNGVKLPLFGLGTWLANDASQLKVALRAALDAGYRYIDTAALYKNEDVIGEVLQEYYNAGKFKREDVFITTKLPFYGHSHVDQFLKKSLENLKTDYIDLYLVHTPLPTKVKADLSQPEADAEGKFVPELVPLIDTWRAVEKQYKSGTVKAIGVSNFNEKQLQELYNQAEIKPQNLQVECHILFPQNELVALCKKLNISVTSYGTLGSPGSIAIRAGPDGNLFSHPLVVELAKKHNKTPAQILLRQMVQRGISTIPKSTNPGRVKENIDVFDFKISDEYMKRFDEIKERLRLYPFGFARHHPWYPFEQ